MSYYIVYRCNGMFPARKSRRIVQPPMLLAFHKTSCTATTLDPIIRLEQVSLEVYFIINVFFMDFLSGGSVMGISSSFTHVSQ